MRFWDSSAVVPLLVEQGSSSRAAAWVAADDAMVLWTLTPVEVVSALRRLARGGALAEDVANLAETRMNQIVHTAHVVIDLEPVKALAARLHAFTHSVRSMLFNSAPRCTGRRDTHRAEPSTRSTAGWPSPRSEKALSFPLEDHKELVTS